MTADLPKQILIIRTGGVGDFILSLPVIRALAECWPEAELEILGRPAIAELAGSRVKRITSVDDRRFASLFTDAALSGSDPATVYLSSFDLAVSFLGVPESDFGARLRSLVPRTFFISPPKASGTRHAVTHFLQALEPAGIVTADPIPRVELPGEAREAGRRLLQRAAGTAAFDPPVIIHPGSGGRHKNWPPRLFAQTIGLFKATGPQPVLLQGEADEATIGEVMDQLGRNQAPVLKDARLVEVAGAIACSQLVVGNDSGISHLAAALGIPLVCLFGPTDPKVWRPLGPRVRVLTFDEATPERVQEAGIALMRGSRQEPDRRTSAT
ncbi:MAG: glycosyltransferase family 9 protein [Acidobacteriota bacterium]